jgi:hypothetical protein
MVLVCVGTVVVGDAWRKDIQYTRMASTVGVISLIVMIAFMIIVVDVTKQGCFVVSYCSRVVMVMNGFLNLRTIQVSIN